MLTYCGVCISKNRVGEGGDGVKGGGWGKGGDGVRGERWGRMEEERLRRGCLWLVQKLAG